MKHLAPEEAEEAAYYGSHPFYEVEHIGGKGTEVEHATRKGGLQHLRRGAHELYEGEEDEQRDEALILPCRWLDVWVADMQHTADAEIARHDEEQQVGLHNLAVEPVVMLSVIEEEDELQHPCRPEQAAQDIETDEW